MPKRSLILLVIAGVVLAFATFVAIRPTTLFDVNGTALSASVEDAINGHSSEPHVAVERCSPKSSGDWKCIGDRDPGSGAFFAISIHSDDSGCWRGMALLRQVFGKSHRGAGDLHGCIRLWDYTGIS
jgi:hypothetical protein